MKLKDEVVQKKEPGLATRTEWSKQVFAKTRDPRASVRAYCQGNVWATENAKAVGNWS
jgi:hypothetical protein